MLVMTNVMPKIMQAQSIIKAYWLILTWATATVTIGRPHNLFV